MSFSLSFSADFFFNEGEPYEYLGDLDRPTSVWSAIEAMREKDFKRWSDMAKEVFKIQGEYLTPETVLDKIQETNTCDYLTPPISVWIDNGGLYVWARTTTGQSPSRDWCIQQAFEYVYGPEGGAR